MISNKKRVQKSLNKQKKSEEVYCGSIPELQRKYIQKVEDDVRAFKGHPKDFKSENGLSARGLQALLPMKDDGEMNYFKKSMEDAYSVESNPKGYLNMLIAENTLTRDLMKEKLENMARTETFPDSVWKYANFQGSLGLR